MTTEIITRQQALRQGLTHYFTGKPCKKGHTDLRYASDRSCVKCCKISANSRRKLNPQSHSEAASRWRHRNPEKCQAYRDKNRGRQKLHSKNWQKNNPEKSKARTARRRAAKLQAIPPWADLEKIKEFYQNCSEGHHVDHIVPLQHPLVCGLHVSENLQYLTAEENFKKGNTWEG